MADVCIHLGLDYGTSQSAASFRIVGKDAEGQAIDTGAKAIQLVSGENESPQQVAWRRDTKEFLWVRRHTLTRLTQLGYTNLDRDLVSSKLWTQESSRAKT